MADQLENIVPRADLLENIIACQIGKSLFSGITNKRTLFQGWPITVENIVPMADQLENTIPRADQIENIIPKADQSENIIPRAYLLENIVSRADQLETIISKGWPIWENPSEPLRYQLEHIVLPGMTN